MKPPEAIRNAASYFLGHAAITQSEDNQKLFLGAALALCWACDTQPEINPEATQEAKAAYTETMGYIEKLALAPHQSPVATLTDTHPDSLEPATSPT